MNKKIRMQFTFYKWFLNGINALPEWLQQVYIYDAISNYAIYGKLPELKKFTPRARCLWLRIFPVLWWERMTDLPLGRNLEEDGQ